jgi:c(7)-type cytochrome triheme protein
MRYVIALLVAIAPVCGAAAAGEDKKPPDKLVFRRPVTIVFDHSAHVKRDKGNCTGCHDKIWPQEVKEPLRSPAGGCRTCHKAGRGAFEFKGNCAKCHPEGTQKQTQAGVAPQ